MLKNRLYIYAKYGIFWLLFFAISRFLFLMYNINLTKELPFADFLLSFAKGFKLDLSVMGYVLFFGGLFFAGAFNASEKLLKKFLNIYTLVFLIPFCVISISDFELYRNWGFRMDSTVLLYLKTPKEALASTKFWLFILLIITTVVITIAAFKFYKYFVFRNLKYSKGNWMNLPIFLILSGLMIIPIRGGLGIAPINTGAVYFSNNTFANHAAINVHWQIGNSLAYINKDENFNILEADVAQKEFDNLFAIDDNEILSLTEVENPNIVIVILESFSSRVVEPLGGLKNVTPNINKLTKEGVLFSRCISNGDRSDKGIVSILSGYPAQPKTSIIKNSIKAEKLPFLTHELNDLGYNSAFYYGGDINFANMRSYLVNSKFKDLITMFDFDEKDRNSKWGIHDHVVFDKLYSDCNTAKEPFFKAFFTLSSHEPFDVPFQGEFMGSDEETMFLNSVNYTDSCLGAYIANAKNSDWWNNTLFFLVADHGGRWPGNVSYASKEKFEIPLLIIGGALSVKDTVINTIVNQVDVPTLIGNQLNKSFTNFNFSKTNFTDKQSFGFFAFNNGFGFANDSAGFIFDNTSQKIIKKSPKTTEKTIVQGKAYMQQLMIDYNTK